jgi:hypothetical protein
MRIVDIQERSIAISRYADSAIPSAGLTTSLVALVTDVKRAGSPIFRYGFSSIGRFAQGGLIRERFAPRLRLSNELRRIVELGFTHAKIKIGSVGSRTFAIRSTSPSMQPFWGLPLGMQIVDGPADLPQAPGIGFELHGEVRRAFQSVLVERG